MYRRIELIGNWDTFRNNKSYVSTWFKQGLCGFFPAEINGKETDAIFTSWDKLNYPRKIINKNVRFYFTEKGWDDFGRKIVKACMECGCEYKVIAHEEHDCTVHYKDEYQVAIMPKRKGRGKQ